MQHYRGVSMWSLLCLVSIIPNDVKPTNMSAANPPGECSSKDGDLRCCANRYLANGTCVECPVGTSKLEEEDLKCSKCDKGSYGRFCAYFCDETCNGRCHPVDGHCCPDHGDACLTELEIDSTKGSEEKELSFNFITVLVPGIILIICVLIFLFARRMYVKFQRSQQTNLTGVGTGKKIVMCLKHFVEIEQYSPEPTSNIAVSFNTSCEDEEDHYCDIRDSAIIPIGSDSFRLQGDSSTSRAIHNQTHFELDTVQRFNACDMTSDLTEVTCEQEYNHLAHCPVSEESSIYTGNVYTKVKFVNRERKESTDILPNYDKMELEKF